MSWLSHTGLQNCQGWPPPRSVPWVPWLVMVSEPIRGEERASPQTPGLVVGGGSLGRELPLRLVRLCPSCALARCGSSLMTPWGVSAAWYPGSSPGDWILREPRSFRPVRSGLTSSRCPRGYFISASCPPKPAGVDVRGYPRTCPYTESFPVASEGGDLCRTALHSRPAPKTHPWSRAT